MDRPGSFRPYERIPNPEGVSGIYLRDPATGKDVTITHAATDAADGVTDDDFDFDAGGSWAQATTAATD